MENYYVNKNTDSNPGNHNEVHKESCHKLPSEWNRIHLGRFSNCHEAVKEAEKKFPNNVDGCVHCSEECHRG